MTIFTLQSLVAEWQMRFYCKCTPAEQVSVYGYSDGLD